MPINPAPSIRQVALRPTPKVSDLLFYELKDSRLAAYSSPPAYGTSHPNTNKYPNHKLVFVEPADDSGWFKWWYAADRESQDDYNYAITYPYSGDEAFPRYTRTYVIPRADYSPLVMGAADPVHDDAVLVGQLMKPMEGQIGSMYVEVTRVYDVIPGQDDGEGLGASQAGGGYIVERPLGTIDFLKLTWTISLPKEIAEDAAADGRADYRACPITGYTDLTLLDETITSESDQDSVRTVRRIYMKQQATPKIDKERLTRNLEPPDKFTTFLERKTSETFVTAASVDNPDSWNGAGTFSSVQSVVAMSTMLQGKKQTIEISFSTTPLTQKVWDDNLGTHVDVTQTSVRTSELAAWLADAGNIATATDFYETTPYNSEWTIVIRTRMPVGSLTDPSASSPTKTGHVLDYYTTRPFAWPRVLTELYEEEYSLKDRAGNTVQTNVTWTPVYKDAWSGICRARVLRWWQKNVFADTVQPIQALTPTAVDVDWPVGSVSILPCLHDDLVFTGTTGTDNPAYTYAGFSKTVVATRLKNSTSDVEAVDWPAKVIADFSLEPYRGGYLCTRIDVFKPY